MSYRINEIFYSIQGEGYWTGRAAIFIRFSGCNLNCDYCDTQHEDFEQWTLREIIQEIDRWPSQFVVLTGGEPALQIDNALIDALHARVYFIAVETNGTLMLPDNIDWITVSPKDKLWIAGNELKLVFQNQDLREYADERFQHFYLQPLSESNIKECVQACKENPRWRLSLQIQKIIKER